MAEGIIPELVGGRTGRKAIEVSRTVKVNSRGSLIIPKQLISLAGLKVGESFQVRKSCVRLYVRNRQKPPKIANEKPQ
jgi:hypothetical protein